MKQKSFFSYLLAGMIMLVAGMTVSCTEDLDTVTTESAITFLSEETGFISGTSTRGTKVSTISSFGVSASVYSSASTYTSAGCGSYFFNEQVTPGVPTAYYWPTSAYKLSFYAYYPYGNAAFTMQSTKSSLGAPTYAYTVPTDIASQLDIMTGQDVNHAGGSKTAVNISMKHRCAAVCFNVTNSRSSAITLTSISIEGVKYSGTLNEETWTLNNAVNSSSSNPFTLAYGSSIAASATANVTGTTDIFMMLPQSIPAGAKIKVVVDGSEELEAELTGSWIAGKQYNYSVEIKNNTIIVVDEDSNIDDWSRSHDYIDLSMVNNAGYPKLRMSTANCYLVHEAGQYSIPLVYGNAIKNGEVNTVAFYPGKDGSISNGVDRFVNHAGTGITGPWITKNGSGVDAGMNIVVDVAELLWQDNIGLISAVDIDGDYLTFTVPADASSKAGNALIAAKSGSTIVWSWHIWITTETLSSTTVVTTDKHSYTVAPVNLGWIPTGGGGKQGYCPYYQWGRKDPFIPSTGSENTNHTMYNISNSSITGLTYQASTSATIASNIINPTYHYYNGSTTGPVKTTYYNMWDSQNSSTDINISTATKKTIYDPCPPGFCVPTGNLYNYIKTNYSTYFAWDSTNMGRLWSKDSPNLWFPASGTRLSNSGSLYNVGSEGYFWSATPNNTYNGNRLNFSSSNIEWFSGSRASGFPVRAVVEE